MIKVLLFDVDGVTSDYKRQSYLRYLSKLTGKSPKELIKIGSPLIWQFDAGRLSLGKFEREAAKLLSIKKSEVKWKRFYSPDTRLNSQVVTLIKKYHKKYRIACLTNMDRSRYIYTKRFLDKVPFDYKFISSYLGTAKPDPKIYRKVLGKLKIKANEMVFIDDNLINISSAKRIGIKTIVFKSSKQLEKELFALLQNA